MTTITFSLRQPGGAAFGGGRVVFTLSGFDLDDGIILSAPVGGAISSAGTGSVDIWPNYAGLKGTSYKVSIQPSGQGSAVDLGSIVVPISEDPVPLHHLIQLGNIGALKTVVLTQAEYDALAVHDGQTTYLIRAGA